MKNSRSYSCGHKLIVDKITEKSAYEIGPLQFKNIVFLKKYDFKISTILKLNNVESAAPEIPKTGTKIEFSKIDI